MKILIIDDSPINRSIVKSIIEKHGHAVIEAIDGQDGLDKAKEHKPGLIVTDAYMPNMDGFQFLRNVKKEEELCHIPCVFYSGVYISEKDTELALSLGAKAFISKAATPKELWNALETILEDKKKDADITDTGVLIEKDEVFFKRYSQTIVSKLEEKVKELENEIIARKIAEEKIKKLSMAIEQSVNIVLITDVAGTIEYVNPMFERVTGYTKEEVLGQNPRILASGETPLSVYKEQWEAICAGKTWRGTFKNKKKDGAFYWGFGVISPITNENGKITHFLAIQEDITEKVKSEERLKYLATYDELTNAFNRTHFIKRLNEWIFYAATNNRMGTLLLISLDKFKLINDTYDRSVGDSLLRNTAGVLKEAVSEIDAAHKDKTEEEHIVIGRMGGAEFAVLLPSRDEKEGLSVAEYLRDKIGTLRLAEINGGLTSSIGVVSYPNHGITAKDILAKADTAIYMAKELGCNRTQLYREGDFLLEKLRSRIVWGDHIQKALAEDRIEPWFQPILDLKDNNAHHYEALVRMRSHDGTIILPGSFIGVAEEMGLVTDIDRVIIEKSLIVQVNLSRRGVLPSISINLSGKELGDEWLLEFLRSRIRATGADPGRLILEITETAAIRELDKAVKFIRELRALGCKFSLDDFGVGFTSFKYLQEMEVDYVKIDGSFIRKLHESKTDRLFVKAIADVAQGMGIKTIAEFVENEEAFRILKDIGVDYAQGYLIGKPAPSI